MNIPSITMYCSLALFTCKHYKKMIYFYLEMNSVNDTKSTFSQLFMRITIEITMFVINYLSSVTTGK